MFVIKVARKAKYIKVSEDETNVAYNLVSVHGATKFETRQDAIEVRDELVNEAQKEVKRLKLEDVEENSQDASDIEDIFLNLIVTNA